MDDSLMLRFDPLSSSDRSAVRTATGIPSDKENLTPDRVSSPISSYFNRPYGIFTQPPPRKQLPRESLVDLSIAIDEGSGRHSEEGAGQSILGDLVGWKRDRVGRLAVREPFQGRNPLSTWLDGVGEEGEELDDCGVSLQPRIKTPVKVTHSSWVFSPECGRTPATAVRVGTSNSRWPTTDSPATVKPGRILQRPIPIPASIPLPQSPERPATINYADSPPLSPEENDEDDTIRLMPPNRSPNPFACLRTWPALSPIPSPHRIPLPLDGDDVSLFETPDPSRTSNWDSVFSQDESIDGIPCLQISPISSPISSPHRIPLPPDVEERVIFESPPRPKPRISSPRMIPLPREDEESPFETPLRSKASPEESVSYVDQAVGAQPSLRPPVAMMSASSPHQIPLPLESEESLLETPDPSRTRDSEQISNQRLDLLLLRVPRSTPNRLSLNIGDLIHEGASFDLIHDEMIIPENDSIVGDEDGNIFFSKKTPNVFTGMHLTNTKEPAIPESEEPVELVLEQPRAEPEPEQAVSRVQNVSPPYAVSSILDEPPSPIIEVRDKVQQPEASSSTLPSPQRSQTTRAAPVGRPMLLRRRESSLALPKPVQPAHAKLVAGRLKPSRSADEEKSGQRRMSVVGQRLPMVPQSRLHAGTASSVAKGKEETREERLRRLLAEPRISTAGTAPPRVNSLRTTAMSHKPRPSISTSIVGTGLKESSGDLASRTGASSSRTIPSSLPSSRTGGHSRATSAASLAAARAAIQHPAPSTTAAIKPTHASHRSVSSISSMRLGGGAASGETAASVPQSTYATAPAASARSRPATVLGMASSRVSGSSSSLSSMTSRLPATLRPASRAGITNSRTRGTGLL
ncbi:hypothetical protein FRB98_004344 [Tulasnella sp. 332]|nr:hypothetical protein FRB98_004344 [Tulasnella sp. 332]